MDAFSWGALHETIGCPCSGPKLADPKPHVSALNSLLSSKKKNALNCWVASDKCAQSAQGVVESCAMYLDASSSVGGYLGHLQYSRFNVG